MIFFMNCKNRNLGVEKETEKERRYKHVQALICPTKHKSLRRLALEQDLTLAELLQEIINFYLKEKETETCRTKKQ